jgi:hypothetical protein
MILNNIIINKQIDESYFFDSLMYCEQPYHIVLRMYKDYEA